MPKQNDKTLKLGKFAEFLPVLTEKTVSETALPVLTETLEPTRAALAEPLTEAQCRQVAAQLAPLLEAALRDKLAARVDSAQWPQVWRELQAELPGLILKELGKPAPRAKK